MRDQKHGGNSFIGVEAIDKALNFKGAEMYYYGINDGTGMIEQIIDEEQLEFEFTKEDKGRLDIVCLDVEEVRRCKTCNELRMVGQDDFMGIAGIVCNWCDNERSIYESKKKTFERLEEGGQVDPEWTTPDSPDFSFQF